MLDLKDYLSQWTLELTPVCQLRCPSCQLWDSGRKERVGILESIKNGSFFQEFPNKRLVNIVGGEPFEHPDFELIVRLLSEQGVKIRLWSNGCVLPEQWTKVMGYLTSVVLYLPTIEPEAYQLNTGFGTWEEFQDSVGFLVKQKVALSFHTPVTAVVVSELPDIYDYVQSKHAKLILHYFSTELFYGEQKAYLKRFLRVRGVSVYKKKRFVPSYVCPVVPYASFEDKVEIIKNAFFDQFK